MKVTCSRHKRSIARLLTTPRAYAQSTTCSSIAGGYAGAPVSSVRKRASKAERSIACVSRWCTACSNVPGSSYSKSIPYYNKERKTQLLVLMRARVVSQ